MKPALLFVIKTILHAAFRLNPFYKPVIPAQLTVYLLAVVFTILYIRDQILCTFIVEYKDMALSAWGFLMLMNFMEALFERTNEKDEEG